MKQKKTSKTLTCLFRFLCLLCALLMVLAVSACDVPEGDEAQTASAEAPAPPQKEYNLPPASEINDLLLLATSAKGTPNEKVCYLTFDDGPTREVTPRILEILKQYDAKATFFMLGRMAEAHPDLVKQVYEEGHLLANHSYAHVYADLYASGESFMAEIMKTHQILTDIIGEEPFRLMRFPGGGHNAGTYGAQKQTYKHLLQENGFYFADWNCLNGDAEYAGTRTPAELLARTRQTCLSQNVVVLMHDAAAKTTTADALPAILDYFKSEGYVFRRLDDVQYYGEENPRPEPDLAL